MKKEYITPAVTVARIATTPVMTRTSMGMHDEETGSAWVREEEELPTWSPSQGQEEW